MHQKSNRKQRGGSEIGAWFHLHCDPISCPSPGQIPREKCPRGLSSRSPHLPGIGCRHMLPPRPPPLAILRFGALSGTPQEAQMLEQEHTYTRIEKKRKKPHRLIFCSSFAAEQEAPGCVMDAGNCEN